MMVTRSGQVVDGDQLVYVIATSRKQRKKLRGPVVGTLMSNLGVEQALMEQGIEFIRAKVGDRYVMEQLLTHDGLIGGESSGHVICLDRTSTGDGIVTALQVLAVIMNSGQSLEELIAPIHLYPQLLVNVRLESGDANSVLTAAAVQQAKQAVEAELKDAGRVLLRPSGTEPVIRVMVEGEDGASVKHHAEHIAQAVRDVSAG